MIRLIAILLFLAAFSVSSAEACPEALGQGEGFLDVPSCSSGSRDYMIDGGLWRGLHYNAKKQLARVYLANYKCRCKRGEFINVRDRHSGKKLAKASSMGVRIK